MTLTICSQPVFPPDSLADKELGQIDSDTLGTDLPLTERLSVDSTLWLNEGFSEVLDDFTDMFSVKTCSDLSSKFSPKLSFVFLSE